MLSRKDWILFVIAASKANNFQPVQLQKALFLIGRNLSLKDLHVDEFYDFQPYDYGPFSSEIYRDAEVLIRQNLIHIDQPVDLSYRLYSLTEKGMSVAKKLMQSLRPEVRNYLTNIAKWTVSLSFRQLVSAIYRHYPDMSVNSVFQK